VRGFLLSGADARLAEQQNKMGRPTKYDPKNNDFVTSMCMLGATDEQLSEALDVSVVTLNAWKKEHPEFLKALKEGKAEADARVGKSLFQRAIGYEHDDVHISNYQGTITKTDVRKHYAPDTTAAIFWLKNRKPEVWRDRVEHTGKDGADLIPPTDTLEVARRLGFILATAANAKAG
jgi:hypothetical protein